jgi:hypothetical protein
MAEVGEATLIVVGGRFDGSGRSVALCLTGRQTETTDVEGVRARGV